MASYSTTGSYDVKAAGGSRRGAASNKPRVSLMGLPRSGKTSISKVVFQKMSPHDSLSMESTTKTIKTDISNNPFMQLQVWDYSGRLDLTDAEADAEFLNCSALVFVIDAQSVEAEFNEALTKLLVTVKKAFRVNQTISLEVFIHKVDGLSDDQKIESQREVQQKLKEELLDARLDQVSPNVYLTSIYDHSIFEAFSKVVQKLIPEVTTLAYLLDALASHCRIEKVFLFDVISKLYVATDSAPVDMQSYELCSDMIDVVIDVSCIYGGKEDGVHDGLAYDSESASVMKLNNGMALYLREVGRFLALVCIMREDCLDVQGLLEFNFQCFREALIEVAETRRLPTTVPPAPRYGS